MKKTLLILVGALITSSATLAQNVNIPDANFKAYLVGNSAINTNSDTEIQVSEATAFSGAIYVSNQSISDLTGIEAFTNLAILRCHDNSLTTLDISNNTNLIELGCNNNSLTTLDLTNNTNLTELRCGNNSLTALNVSNNIALTHIDCGSNPITSLDVSNHPNLNFLGCNYNSTLMALDVSNNPILTQIYCNDTPISALNVANGNNANFTTFVATNTPNLTCIQVDDVNYSTTNWTLVDAGASFSTNCNYALGVNELELAKKISIYPNPAKSEINISSDNIIESIEFIDVFGKVIKSSLNSNNTIDVSNLSNGLYFLQVYTKEGSAIKKFIKD
jgi:Leucine-rich repeat (LRR) protein